MIDSSTVDPAVSKELADKSAMMGAVFVDAPVSGGINAAAAGTLTFMVSAKTGRYFFQKIAVKIKAIAFQFLVRNM